MRTSRDLHVIGSRQHSVQVTFAFHGLACMDPTVYVPLQKALIEQHFGEKVPNAPPELLLHLIQRFKSLGNTAVRLKQFQGQRLTHLACNFTPYSRQYTGISLLSVCRSCQVVQPGHSCSRS